MRREARRLDLPTILGVAAGGVGLVAALVFIRFCGAIAMPDKPDEPRFDKAPEQIVKDINSSSDAYQQMIERDAGRAAISTPTIAEQGRAFTFTRDDQRRVLTPGGAPQTVGGVRISSIVHRIEGSEQLLALVIENPGSQPMAYVVETEVSGGNAACQGRTMLPYNGMVVAPGRREIRSECAYKRGVELYVNRVETAVVTPMAAYYLSLVPPQAVGAADRVGRGHRPVMPGGVIPCSVAMAQNVRSAMEEKKTGWRDLVDFYARHPCDTYQFPDEYKAFTANGERSLPVTGP